MLRRLFLAGLLGLLAAGCSKPAPAFKATDVTGAAIGADFSLSGHDGKAHRLSDFKGKAVVLFFGYTHCPDVCPTTMSELAIAIKQLGNRAGEVQVLFVTLDPERDDAKTLAQYVPAFNADFLGLTGTAVEVKSVADSFKVVFQKAGSDPKNYSIDHSAGSYILDKTGKLRLFVNYGAGGEVFAHDLKLLLES